MTMAFCYDKLWKLLIDKHMNKVELRDAVGITPATLAKMGKNQNVSMEVLGRICQILDCNIGDIMDYIHEVQEEK
jgi:DNA-binding Xre family transcriptional regulator